MQTIHLFVFLNLRNGNPIYCVLKLAGQHIS